MIVFNHVSISYLHEKVLSDFSMEVRSGEKITLAGSSGSGKSTLLNAILGFVKPDNGEISVNNHLMSPKTIKTIRSQTAWLPQDLSFDIKHCKELVLFPFKLAANKANIPSDKELWRTMEKLLLDPQLLEKETNQISGGQKQRLMLTSILLLKKPIILLDEPTSALDADSTNALVEYIRQMKETTVIGCSHDPLWNNNMDRIININKP